MKKFENIIGDICNISDEIHSRANEEDNIMLVGKGAHDVFKEFFIKETSMPDKYKSMVEKGYNFCGLLITSTNNKIWVFIPRGVLK